MSSAITDEDPSETDRDGPAPDGVARMLIHDLHVIVIDRDTGEIRRERVIDPDRDSQPRGVKPGPRPGHRKGGMPKGYKFKK